MRLARRQGGVVSRRQALSCGLSGAQVDYLVRSGQLLRENRAGVYRSAAAPATADSARWAAVLATRSVLSHSAAAHLWEFPVPDDGLLHVTAPARRRTVMPPGVRVHRVLLAPTDVTERFGLPVTAAAATVLDCLGCLSVPDSRRLADRALQQGWVQLRDMERRLLDQRGRWGNRRIGNIYRECGRGGAAVSERRLHALLRRAGLEGWQANRRVAVAGRTYELDVCFESCLLAIEVDGWAYHCDVETFRRDRRKQNALVAGGWTVLRFTWADLIERPDLVIATIQAALGRIFAA